MLLKKQYLLIIFISFILHLCAVYFSLGWYAADEQSCVLEYLNSKLGNISDNCLQSIDLRSWFQPYIYYLITKFVDIFINYNVFTNTIILKLISSLIGFCSLIILFISTKNNFIKNNSVNFYFYSIFIFWFYPFLHARTSSENLSISLLFIGVSLYNYILNKENILKLFILGIIFGLAFVLRYNLGISIFFIMLWGFIYSKNTFINKSINIFIILLGIIFILYIESLINFWGYERKGIYPLVQYLKYGFLGSATKFKLWSIVPIWGYFDLIFFKFFPPLSLIFIFAMLFTWIKGRNNIITWATLPFFIVHSFLPHKEFRYIFPVIAFAPFFITYIYDNSNIIFKFFKKKLGKILLFLLILLNLIALIFISFQPLIPELKTLKFIYNNSDDIKEIYFVNNIDHIKRYESLNPFNLKNITLNYYFHFDKILLINKENIEELPEYHVNEKIILDGSNGFCNQGTCSNIEQEFYQSNSLVYYLYYNKNKKEPNLKINLIESKNISENEILKFNKNKKIYILTKEFSTFNKLISINKCKLITSSNQEWLLKIEFNNINERIPIMGLFSCY